MCPFFWSMYFVKKEKKGLWLRKIQQMQVGLFHCALHPFQRSSTFPWRGTLTSERLLEWRDGWTNSASWTWGIVLRLRGDLSGGEDEVGTVGGTDTNAVREVGSELHILVASSSENLLLFIKCRGLREGDSSYRLGSTKNYRGVASFQLPMRHLVNVKIDLYNI